VSGALTWARLSYRQQRWELILVAIGVVGAAAAMVWFASTLDAMRAANPDCAEFLRNQGDPGLGPPLACQPAMDAWWLTIGYTTMLQTFALVAPFGIGVVLGAPLVAREVDGGTAQLAWSLSRSRIGWFVRRLAFVVAIVALLLAIVASASELMAAATQPDRDLSEDFLLFGQRGLPVVARGVGALMIGVLVGAIIGRVLPAVLAAALVVGLAFAGLSLGQEAWNRGEATVQRFYDASGQPIPFDFAALDLDYGIQRPDGTFLTYDEFFEGGELIETYNDEMGRVYASEADLAAGRVLGDDARLVIPAERYPELALRDSLIWVVAGLAALGAAAIVVVRRRPT
jgi:hypothetical protein